MSNVFPPWKDDQGRVCLKATGKWQKKLEQPYTRIFFLLLFSSRVHASAALMRLLSFSFSFFLLSLSLSLRRLSWISRSLDSLTPFSASHRRCNSFVSRLEHRSHLCVRVQSYYTVFITANFPWVKPAGWRWTGRGRGCFSNKLKWKRKLPWLSIIPIRRGNRGRGTGSLCGLISRSRHLNKFLLPLSGRTLSRNAISAVIQLDPRHAPPRETKNSWGGSFFPGRLWSRNLGNFGCCSAVFNTKTSSTAAMRLVKRWIIFASAVCSGSVDFLAFHFFNTTIWRIFCTT